MAKNLLSDIAEIAREGESMLDVVLVNKTEPLASALRYMSILRQRAFLRQVVRADGRPHLHGNVLFGASPVVYAPNMFAGSNHRWPTCRATTKTAGGP